MNNNRLNKNKYKKTILLGMLLCIFGIAFTSCAFIPLSRGHIKEYTATVLGHDNFKLSLTSKKTDDSDHTWTVHDYKNQIDFIVTDDCKSIGDIIPSFERVQFNDYNYQLMMKHSDIIPDCATLSDDSNKYLIIFDMTYETPKDLELECSKMWDYFMSLQKIHKNFEISYRFIFSYPAREDSEYGLAPDIEYDIADDYDSLGYEMEYNRLGQISKADMIDEAKNHYYALAYTYQFNDMLKNASAEDKKRVMDLSTVYHVGTIDEEGFITFYDVVTPSSNSITYGSFYELLKQCNMNVDGDSEDFTFTNENGDVYEFSYDFFGNDGVYYLKNGEECFKKDYENAPELTIEEVAEISGLKIDIRNSEDMNKVERTRDYIIY